MRLGRINTRALSGPMRLPNGASEMVERVVKTYEAWFKVWSDTYIPKLLFQPKWFKNESDLKIGDLVYFKKSESELGATWILGMISEVERSRDGLIRKVLIKYRNSSETQDRTTRRNVRTVCKIWSEDDWNVQDDLAELANRLESVDGGETILGNLVNFQPEVENTRVPPPAEDSCCCVSHCNLLQHGASVLRSYQAILSINKVVCDMSPQAPSFKLDMVEDVDERIPDMNNLTDFLMYHNMPWCAVPTWSLLPVSSSLLLLCSLLPALWDARPLGGHHQVCVPVRVINDTILCSLFSHFLAQVIHSQVPSSVRSQPCCDVGELLFCWVVIKLFKCKFYQARDTSALKKDITVDESV